MVLLFVQSKLEPTVLTPSRRISCKIFSHFGFLGNRTKGLRLFPRAEGHRLKTVAPIGFVFQPAQLECVILRLRASREICRLNSPLYRKHGRPSSTTCS